MVVSATFESRDLAVLVQGMWAADSAWTRETVGLLEEGAAIVLVRVPRPLMDTEIVSPGARNTGGDLPMPTPAGFGKWSV